MGNRGNIAVIQDKERKEQVWLYSHWGGSELPAALQRGIAASKSRWDDVSYCTKIIFGHAVPADNWKQETGYGISTSMQDNQHPINVVDLAAKQVFTMPESKLVDSRVPASYKPEPGSVWTFEEYARLELATD